MLAPLRVGSGEVAFLQPALAWLDGWLAEQLGGPEEAQRIYQRGEDTAGTDSPVHTARLLLAHGRLLRRTGHRKDAVERLRPGERAVPGSARRAVHRLGRSGAGGLPSSR